MFCFYPILRKIHDIAATSHSFFGEDHCFLISGRNMFTQLQHNMPLFLRKIDKPWRIRIPFTESNPVPRLSTSLSNFSASLPYAVFESFIQRKRTRPPSLFHDWFHFATFNRDLARVWIPHCTQKDTSDEARDYRKATTSKLPRRCHITNILCTILCTLRDLRAILWA